MMLNIFLTILLSKTLAQTGEINILYKMDTIKGGRYNKDYNRYDSLVQYAPKDSNFWFHLYSRAILKQVCFLNYTSSLEDLKRAERYCTTKRNLSDIVDQQRQTYRLIGRYKKSIALCKRIDRISFKSGPENLPSGGFYAIERTKDSLKVYKRNIVTLNKKRVLNADEYLLRSRSRFMLGRRIAAFKDVNYVIENIPNASAYFLRGQFNSRLGLSNV
jgi:tetratricopeptide (TPR) repeat protein